MIFRLCPTGDGDKTAATKAAGRGSEGRGGEVGGVGGVAVGQPQLGRGHSQAVLPTRHCSQVAGDAVGCGGRHTALSRPNCHGRGRAEVRS